MLKTLAPKVAGVAAAVLLVSCASQPPTGTAASSLSSITSLSGVVARPATLHAVRVTSVEELSSFGLRLEPAPANVNPHMSPSAAYTVSCALGCDRATPTTRLGVLRIDQSVIDAGAAQEYPGLDHTLVYVFTWTNLPCAPAGAPAGSTPTPTTCTQYQIADANTGQYLDAMTTYN